MSLPSLEPVSANRHSKLNRAIVVSVIAMAAMNLFVLAQQLQAAPLLALSSQAHTDSLV